MKTKLMSRIFSTFLCAVLIIISLFSVYDYLLVKNNHRPIFCIKKDIKGESYTCKSILYKYYYSVGDNYVNLRFVPIWEELREKK